MTDFNTTGRSTIEKIVLRAAALRRQNGLSTSKSDELNMFMDLCAADGVNGNRPLRLNDLLGADDQNFAHDVFGIARHMDRDTGTIGDHFIPRFTS